MRDFPHDCGMVDTYVYSANIDRSGESSGVPGVLLGWQITPIGFVIGVYRDVWIAAIASSRTRLASLTGAMCKTSQCEFRSLRVNSGMLNVIRIVTYYTLAPLESPDSFWIAMSLVCVIGGRH